MIEINRNLISGELEQEMFEFSSIEELQVNDRKKVNIKWEKETGNVLVETLSNDREHISREIKKWLKKEKAKLLAEQKEIDNKLETIKKAGV